MIGITPDLSRVESNRAQAEQEPALFLPQRYCHAVEDVGGIPLVLPFMKSPSARRQILRGVDGLVITGGNFDIHPSYYGEKPIKALGEIKQQRTDFELELVSLALQRDLPLLGICGGAQAINVALGGSLYQDISTQFPNAGQHQQGTKIEIGGHRIRIHAGTQLRQIVRRQSLEVNTTHHQAVKRLGKGLVVNATAEDGLIEGIESPHHAFVLGVQWHPEAFGRKPISQRRIFSSFVSMCRRLRRGK